LYGLREEVSLLKDDNAKRRKEANDLNDRLYKKENELREVRSQLESV